jgi:folate-binding protein YgfZ
MTTNNILALRPGQSCVTVLTSPTAKIVQVFTVLARADELLLLPAPGEATALERHLRGQIFFMDKVKVANLSADYTRCRVVGPQAAQAVAALGLNLTGAPDGAWQEQDGLLALRQDRFDIPGVELLAPTDRAASVSEQLSAAGVLAVADTLYTARRVELGRPAPGAELTGAFNPLEAGLAWACAENKGCYTGQEIIARQLTYDKVTQSLVGLRTAALLEVGAPVTIDGRTVGVVTSSAISPALGAPVALAVVKRPHNALGTAVTVAGLAGEVVELPFVA